MIILIFIDKLSKRRIFEMFQKHLKPTFTVFNVNNHNNLACKYVKMITICSKFPKALTFKVIHARPNYGIFTFLNN